MKQGFGTKRDRKRDRDWRGTGKEGFGTAGIQETRDSGLEEKGRIWDEWDSGLEVYRKGWIREWRDTGNRKNGGQWT